MNNHLDVQKSNHDVNPVSLQIADKLTQVLLTRSVQASDFDNCCRIAQCE